MKTRMIHTIVPAFALALGLQAPLLAQTSTPPPTAPEPEKTVVMDTFTVNTDKDNGYIATDSLAGHRDGAGIVREVATGCRDETSARQMLADLMKRSEHVKSGLVTQAHFLGFLDQDLLLDHLFQHGLARAGKIPVIADHPAAR